MTVDCWIDGMWHGTRRPPLALKSSVFRLGTFGVQPELATYRRYELISENLLASAPSDRIRLFAGQPDPADPSHFTIGYAVNGRPGTIDGWLQDDERVKFRVRGGPAKKP